MNYSSSSSSFYPAQPKHHPWRPPRMQAIAAAWEDRIHGAGSSFCYSSLHSSSLGKQPRPLENGNWVCDDQRCNNVNYPRRKKCHRCGMNRGPAGDAVVRSYVESLSAAAPVNMNMNTNMNVNGMPHAALPLPVPVACHAPRLTFLGSPVLACGRMVPQGAKFRGGIPISMTTTTTTTGLAAAAASNKQRQPQPQGYVFNASNDVPATAINCYLSPAIEGRRVAEQLMRLFSSVSSSSSSADDVVKDCSHCLAYAQRWLHALHFNQNTCYASRCVWCCCCCNNSNSMHHFPNPQKLKVLASSPSSSSSTARAVLCSRMSARPGPGILCQDFCIRWADYEAKVAESRGIDEQQEIVRGSISNGSCAESEEMVLRYVDSLLDDSDDDDEEKAAASTS